MFFFSFFLLYPVLVLLFCFSLLDEQGLNKFVSWTFLLRIEMIYP